MRKDEFIKLIQISLNGGTPPADSQGKFHDVVIEKHVGMAYNEVVSQIKDRKVLDQFVVVYRNQPVLIDSELNLRYINLPVPLINTVQGSAVRYISPMKDQTTSIFIRPNHSQATYRHLPVSYMFSTRGAARVEGDRIYFDGLDENIDEVLLKILPSFESISEDDEFEMPGGKDSVMFRLILEQLQQQYQTPESYRNDNNSNTK